MVKNRARTRMRLVAMSPAALARRNSWKERGMLTRHPMATMSPIPLAAAVQVSRSVPKSYEPPTTA